MSSRFPLFLLCILLTFLIGLFALTQGSAQLSLRALFLDDPTILLSLRLPRTLSAFISGALLALAGSLMQLLLHNPLADPFVLGVSSGAGLFTLIAMLLGFSENGVLLASWLGSSGVIILIICLGRQHRFHTHHLLLIGIALASGLSALMSFLLLLAGEVNLHSMLFWLSGDIHNIDIPWLSLSILCISCLFAWLLAPILNILGRGEKEAKALGVASETYRPLIFLLAALCTATAVTLSGCIGFIGLIVPHLTRRLVGFDHRILLPIATLIGGSLLMLAEAFARSLLAPQQLPVGILIAFIGAPIFIWLIHQKT